VNPEIQAYNDHQLELDRAICNLLAQTINSALPEAESKVWHAHPVWFLDGNPVVGYSKLKHSVRLLFWSGQSFDEPQLKSEGKFKAAEKAYLQLEDIDLVALKRWLEKARTVQWDYKNIVKRKGVQLPLTAGLSV
jgi:hypothetical protein